jgi:hypothetical protein
LFTMFGAAVVSPLTQEPLVVLLGSRAIVRNLLVKKLSVFHLVNVDASEPPCVSMLVVSLDTRHE